MKTAEKASPDLAKKGNVLGLDITEKKKPRRTSTINVDICLALYLLFIIIDCPV
jgi:hypothetical protein